MLRLFASPAPAYTLHYVVYALDKGDGRPSSVLPGALKYLSKAIIGACRPKNHHSIASGSMGGRYLSFDFALQNKAHAKVARQKKTQKGLEASDG